MSKEQLEAAIEEAKKNLIWNESIKDQIPKEASVFWRTIYIALMNDRERFDATGAEIIGVGTLHSIVKAYKDGRVVVIPDCKKCKNYAARDAIYPQGIGAVYPCEGCVGLIKIKRYPNNKFEPERALSSVINQVDRCSTCDNNGKPICSSCIMTGHGNDIDFYRAAADAGKGENG